MSAPYPGRSCVLAASSIRRRSDAACFLSDSVEVTGVEKWLREKRAGGSATLVSLKQAAVALPQNATEGQIAAATATLETLRGQVTGCGDLEAKASTLEVVSNPKPQWIKVSRVGYARHDKPGKPPSLRVDYWSGLTHHSEWVCIEHPGYARQKAVAWWTQRAPGLPVPVSVEDALQHADQLRCPAQIAVRAQGRYTQVVGVRFVQGGAS